MKCHIDALKDQRYIPDHSTEQRHDNLDMVIYLYPGHDSLSSVSAVCYEGRRTKPSFNLRFMSAERRSAYVLKWTEDRQKEVDAKLADRQLKRDFKTTLTVGSILSASWGWEQTNVEFWQVLGVKSPKRVLIRPIEKRLAEDGDHSRNGMAGKVIPVNDAFLDNSDPVEKQVSIGNRITFSKYRRLSPWSGKPQYCSWYG